MAYTLWSGMQFDPDIFMEYVQEQSTEPAAFVASGILRPDPGIASQMSEQGNIFSVPYFSPLTGNSQNYDGSDITVNAIGTDEVQGVVIGRSNAWGAQDLAVEIASADPMKAIAASIADYWRREKQRILITTLNGVFAAASMAVLLNDIAIEDGNNATAANKLTATTMIAAIQACLGDNGGKIVALAIHSKIYAALQTANLITFVPFEKQNILIPYFLDKVLIVDDQMPVVAGGVSGFKYTTYLFAKSSIATAPGKVKIPVEAYRLPLEKGGLDTIINRDRFVYHPYGVSFTKAAMATVSPTDAELATAANWVRKYDKKNIAIIKMVTNG